MAVYKVPQDVEAEDKLIGPFGFRQFIYLLIVAFACFIAFILSQIFIGLVLIPLPFILFFAALALPLRKDQPTEVYLAALLQFTLKSKKRLWKPDGVNSTVEVLASRKVEDHRTKDLSEDDAMTQFEQLAQIMDTRGWAGRGVFNPEVATTNMKLSASVVQETAQTADMLASDSNKAQSFDTLIDQQRKISLQEAEKRMKEASLDMADSAIAVAGVPPQPQVESEADKALLSQAKPDRYPVSIHQQVIQPLSAQAAAPAPVDSPSSSPPPVVSPPPSTSSEPPLAAIIEPANDSAVTIATIAAAAKRRSEHQIQEVVVKLH